MVTAPHHSGHRARLRNKLRQLGAHGLADYEVLELLLMQAIPRRDVKPLAKDLLQTFKSIHGVLEAPFEKLCAAGLSEPAATTLILAREVAVLYRKEVATKHKFTDRLALLDYLYAKFGGLTREEFHILFLDSKNQLIADECMFTGTLNSSAVYPREIMKRALDKGAASLVLIHNHPSGDPTPSTSDEYLTRDIAAVAAGLAIDVYDHLIIGDNCHYSFRDSGKL
jgi:DNA repair protein RadC